MDILNHAVIISTGNKQKVIKSVGIIAGTAGTEWKHALDKGCDAFITGEMGHHHWTDSRESGLTIFAGGHEANEELGIIALMNKVKKTFGNNIEVEFIKSKNPI
jgi:putative NIF3 family GTP cyclohydrolase 1 type 2